MQDARTRIEENLDKVYRTIATPVAVAATLGINAIAYLTTVSEGYIVPADVINAYSFTLFFVLFSVVSYLVGYFRRPLLFKSLAIIAILTTLTFPVTIAQAWITLGNLPWLGLVGFEVVLSYL